MSEKKIYQKLPAILQTTAIKNFFESTVEQLFSKSNVESIQGYIGSPSSDDVNVSGKFLLEPTTVKKFYGLTPAVNTLNTTTGKSENLFFYDELVETLDTYGVNTKNHNKMFSEKFASFLPPVDIDKFTNYQEYYWYPKGPSSISVTGSVTNYIDIDKDIIGKATFTPVGGKAFRNGMVVSFSGDYVIPASKHSIEYIIQGVGTSILLTKKDINLSSRYTSTLYSSTNIDLTYKTAGAIYDTVTYTAPQTGDAITSDVGAPEPYIKGSNAPGIKTEIKTVNVGTLNRYNGTTTLSDGTTTVSVNHASTQPRNMVELVTQLKAASGYSSLKFTIDVADRAPVDYVVQEKNAVNKNAWSRINFWYHKNNFIDASDSLPSRSFRASRPIIEFDKDLELYNHGTGKNIADVDAVAYNYSYKDLDGCPSTTLIDGVNRLNYDSIIFNNEVTAIAKYVYTLRQVTGNPVIASNVGSGATFNVTLTGKGRDSTISAITVTDGGSGYSSIPTITIGHASGNAYGSGATATATISGGAISGITVTNGGSGYYKTGQYRIEQIGDPDTNPAGSLEGNALFKPLIASTNQTIAIRSGETQIGKEFRWDGLQWLNCQEKSLPNQAPLFNLYDSNGVSLDDVAVYPTSTFKGSKIFGYCTDVPTANATNISKSTVKDTELGTELVYKQYNAQSEILFENYIETEAFNFTPFGSNTATGVTLGASNTGGPYSINGYYPLYARETLAQAAGTGTTHEHVFFGKTFYMPDGLIMGTTQFHGDYDGTLTSAETIANTTTVSAPITTNSRTINTSNNTQSSGSGGSGSGGSGSGGGYGY
tara:strand:- start:5923 stop:8385 length:2463 start_codon:yes stop_codon:yes gene_type:complete